MFDAVVVVVCFLAFDMFDDYVAVGVAVCVLRLSWLMCVLLLLVGFCV